MDELVNKLLNYTISPYDMVEHGKKEPSAAVPIMKNIITNHCSPYARLCAAWTLGEIADEAVMPLLKKAYKNEKEINVRANLAWALFMINQTQIDSRLFNKFLKDTYYIIQLVALKRLSGLHHLQGFFDFLSYFNSEKNILVRLELLRNIRCFKYNKSINLKLKKHLYKTTEKTLILELIYAIGATNQIDSIDILMNYYKDFKKKIHSDETIAYALTRAMLSLSQSKPYTILYDIYIDHSSHLIKLNIIETLTSAGGPQSQKILQKILAFERDQNLKKQIQKNLEIFIVTIK